MHRKEEGRVMPRPYADETRTEVFRQLALDKTDDVAARNLSISLSTLRRIIRDAREEAGVAGRFGLGHYLGQREEWVLRLVKAVALMARHLSGDASAQTRQQLERLLGAVPEDIRKAAMGELREENE
jgi:hypothetical protein